MATRLVVRTRRPGQAASRAATWGTAPVEVLDVVQDEQQPALTDGPPEPVERGCPVRPVHLQCLGDDREHERGVGNRGEGDECDAVGEISAKLQFGRHLQRQACLADAPWAGQRDQADVVPAEHGGDGGRLGGPSDQRRYRVRQRGRRELPIGHRSEWGRGLRQAIDRRTGHRPSPALMVR